MKWLKTELHFSLTTWRLSKQARKSSFNLTHSSSEMAADIASGGSSLELVLDCKNKRYIRWPFGRLALLLARHSPLRGCPSLAPRQPPKWPAGYIAYFCNQALVSQIIFLLSRYQALLGLSSLDLLGPCRERPWLFLHLLHFFL